MKNIFWKPWQPAAGEKEWAVLVKKRTWRIDEKEKVVQIQIGHMDARGEGLRDANGEKDPKS